MREQLSSYAKKVTLPEPYGVKVEAVKGLYGECHIRRAPGDDRSRGHFTWQTR